MLRYVLGSVYIKSAKLLAKSGAPDKTPRSAASDLCLHCLLNLSVTIFKTVAAICIFA